MTVRLWRGRLGAAVVLLMLLEPHFALAQQAAAAPAAPPAPMAPRLPQTIAPDPFAGLSKRMRQLARRDDAAKERHHALQRWESVLALVPADREARERIAALRKDLARRGRQHFALAQGAYKAKQYGRAFREFLRTLSYDPDNHIALTMVKYELNAHSVLEYTVQRGDSLRKIAEAEYDDPAMESLIRVYNELGAKRFLTPGQILRLPVIADVKLSPRGTAVTVVPAAKAPSTLEAGKAPPVKAPAVVGQAPATPTPAVATATPPKPPARAASAPPPSEAERTGAGYGQTEPEGDLGAAQALYGAGRNEEAAAAVEAVLEEDPVNQEARELANAIYYAQGETLRAANQPVAALQMFARVEPMYKDVRAVMAKLQSGMSGQRAEVHYIVGVTAYLEENLDTAIREWEITLKLDPKHPQAQKDLENARALRAKLAQVR